MDDDCGVQSDKSKEPHLSMKPRIFYSHHKCGTMWLDSIFRTLCRETGHKYKFYVQAKDFAFDLDSEIGKQKVDFATYADSVPKYLPKPGTTKGVHVVRDPRDVLISGYFSHLKTHVTYRWEALVKHRAALEKLPLNEGLRLEMDFSDQFFQSLRTWRERAGEILEIRYEQIINDEFRTIMRILSHLEFLKRPRDQHNYERFGEDLFVYGNILLDRLKLSSLSAKSLPSWEQAAKVIMRNTFEVKSAGRTRGVADTGSHFRKGVAGDWRNYFDKELASAFACRYQEILEKYGYEQSVDWVDKLAVCD